MKKSLQQIIDESNPIREDIYNIFNKTYTTSEFRVKYQFSRETCALYLRFYRKELSKECSHLNNIGECQFNYNFDEF